MYRTIGKTLLTWADLEEVLLDIDNQIILILNNRPLTYIEEEIDYPILTPNSLIVGYDVIFPDAALYESKSTSNDVKRLYLKDGNMSI